MKQNVASQVIGAQMVSATDGSAFTGAVTVSVTGNGGTQATGSVGAGACTHEGNGFHTYAPAQAETNYTHVAFTFTGTGAVPATVQVYTTFPQTGDGFARLGAPAGASVSADVAAVKVDTAAILIDTAEIGAAGAGLTVLATQTSVNTIDDLLDTEMSALTTAVADLPTNAELATALGTADDAVLAAIAALNNLSQANIRTAVGLASANLDTQIGTLATAAALTTVDDFLDTEIAAIKAKTDSLTFTTAGMVDAAIKRVGNTTLAAAGTGGQGYGA